MAFSSLLSGLFWRRRNSNDNGVKVVPPTTASLQLLEKSLASVTGTLEQEDQPAPKKVEEIDVQPTPVESEVVHGDSFMEHDYGAPSLQWSSVRDGTAKSKPVRTDKRAISLALTVSDVATDQPAAPEPLVEKRACSLALSVSDAAEVGPAISLALSVSDGGNEAQAAVPEPLVERRTISLALSVSDAGDVGEPGDAGDADAPRSRPPIRPPAPNTASGRASLLPGQAATRWEDREQDGARDASVERPGRLGRHCAGRQPRWTASGTEHHQQAATRATAAAAAPQRREAVRLPRHARHTVSGHEQHRDATARSFAAARASAAAIASLCPRSGDAAALAPPTTDAATVPAAAIAPAAATPTAAVATAPAAAAPAAAAPAAVAAAAYLATADKIAPSAESYAKSSASFLCVPSRLEARIDPHLAGSVEERMERPPPWLAPRARKTSAAHEATAASVASAESAARAAAARAAAEAEEAAAAKAADRFRLGVGLGPKPPPPIGEADVETVVASHELVAVLRTNEVRVRVGDGGGSGRPLGTGGSLRHVRPRAFEEEALYLQINGRPSLPELVRPEHRLWMTSCAKRHEEPTSNELHEYACFHLASSLEQAAGRKAPLNLQLFYRLALPGHVMASSEARCRIRILRLKKPMKRPAKWAL